MSEQLTLNDLRPEVAAFALLMERELRANDHKPGWKGCAPEELFEHLKEEVAEVEALHLDFDQAPASAARIGEELADVANMAMMVADVCGALK